jgi:hypothetical protein
MKRALPLLLLLAVLAAPVLSSSVLASLALAAEDGAAPAPAAAPDLSLSPSEIEIGASYNGLTLTVTGQVPDGTQAVVRFIGEPQALNMKEKGKAFGLLWMNMDSLHFTNVPGVCILDSSARFADLGPAGSALNLDGLASGIRVEPSSAKDAGLVAELLHFKRADGLYRQNEGGVALGEARDGLRPFTATLAIPSRLSAGAYSVEVVAVRDGQTVARAAKPLQARLIGAPRLLSDLAFGHAAWYGALSALLAILGGLAIGLVFQSKEAH